MSDNSPQKGEAEGYVIGTPFYTLAHWQHSCQRQADTIREQDAEIAVLRSDLTALRAALDETQADLAASRADFAGAEGQLAEADKALNEIRTICSQIDQIARKGLG